MYPDTLKYTRDHEWIRVEDGVGRVGITDFAQKQLGDVVYVDLPEVGATLRQGQAFGTIESVKAVSELFSPVSGEVIEVNDGLRDAPERVNSDPHATWMVAIRLAQPGEAETLLDSAGYADLVK
jgi:glycine cleavage system H protein